MKPKKLVHGSLFSGIGGFDLAAASLGWKNAFHCEINPFCNKILRYWFPESVHYEDITKTDFTPWRGRIDVLSGGFPCQPFSLAGQRRGAEDDRYLWPQMLRVIREVRPTFVIGENVAGIATMVQPGDEVEVASGRSLFGEDNAQRVSLRQEYVIETVCSDLEREGYSVQPIVVPACAVGAPHRRDRVWFIAHRTDAGAEAMQREGTDGVCAAGAAAHTQCCRGSEVQHHLQPQQSDGPGIDGIGGERYAAHADGERCNHGSYNRGERHIRTDQERYSKENKPERTERKHRSGKDGTAIFAGNAAYADIYRLPTFRVTQRNDSEEWSYKERCAEKHPGNDGATLPADRWKNFPTQPPVCRRDDELSARLDGITFSKWRQESVKAYGNAVVPALVVEIFKAIEQQYQ